MIYAYGVINILKTADTVIDYFYDPNWTDEEIDRINQTYDAVILPMADAFRVDYQKSLENYIKLIQKLKIAVVVIGIGLRADYEPDISSGFQFDDVATRFISAVLDKSAQIGLRGHITADYLKKLGFIEGTHYSAIGCPSLYTYGNGVTMKPVSSNIEHVAVNINDYYHIGHINDMFINTVNRFSDVYLVQQIQAEFIDLFIGKRFPFSHHMKNIPDSILGDKYLELKKNDRVRYFFDTISWVNFLKRFDIFVGNRFHGSVAAILAGTPNIMFPFNARTREMTEYHHLTCLRPDEVREGTSIIDYLDQLDFDSYESNKRANLDHYIDFLNRNGLDETIFQDKLEWEQGESPLEKQIQEKMNTGIAEICSETVCFESLSRSKKWGRSLSCYGQVAKAIIKR